MRPIAAGIQGVGFGAIAAATGSLLGQPTAAQGQASGPANAPSAGRPNERLDRSQTGRL
jgi:hypothetical protein